MNQILEKLIDFDKSLLLQLNGSSSSYLDQVMMIYTGKMIWIPLVLVLVYLIWRKGWKEALIATIAIVLVAVLCDQISSQIFKPYFARFRPTHDPELSSLVKIVDGYRGGKYGFISSHAANGFGLVMFTILLFRNKFYTVSGIIWASVSCYSRMYLGVHYPGDILGGMVLGILVGYTVFILYKKFRLELYFRGKLSLKNIPYLGSEGSILSITLILLYITILILAWFFPLH